MSENKQQITVEATVAAPIAHVWRAYTTPADIEQWNAASDDWHTVSARNDLRAGGDFSFRMEAKDGSMGFDLAGTYTLVEPQQRIEYTLGDRAVVTTFSGGAGGVLIRVTFDPDAEYPLEQQRAGWQAILDRFAAYASLR